MARDRLVGLTIAVLALLLPGAAGCGAGATPIGSGASPSPSAPREGGTYNFPLSLENLTLAPFDDMGEARQVAHQVFEGLVRYESRPDGSLATVPCLAERWSANADATVWTFKLRRGVRFQAPVSREVTAEDVVADLEYVADPASQTVVAYMLAPIRGTDGFGYAAHGKLRVAALDRYTVRFFLKAPFAEFADTLGGPATWVWPVDQLRKVGKARFAEHPIGTGPYRLARWVRGEYVDLTRNLDWWNAGTGGPYIDTLHFPVFHSVSSEMLAFQKGMLDCTWVPAGQVEASKSLAQVKSGRWKATAWPSLLTGYLGVNMRDPVVGGAAGLRLRQALSYGHDPVTLLAAMTDGVYVPLAGLLPPSVPGSGETSPYRYDPAKAATLFRQAGSPTLRLLHDDSRRAVVVAHSLKASYAKLGLTLRLEQKRWDPFLHELARGTHDQLFLIAWIADYPSTDNFLHDLFHSRLSPSTSCTFYANPDVDRLLALARATPDQQKRRWLNARAERQILADAPVVPLFVAADYRLTSERIANLSLNAMGYVDMWTLWVR